MLKRRLRPLTSLLLLCSLMSMASARALLAQQTPVPFASGSLAEDPKPTPELMANGIVVLHGKDPISSIAYTRVFLAAGTPPPQAEQTTAPLALAQPTLTGQCTQDASGKLRFEVFANFGGVTDLAFYPPWHSSPHDLYPPRTLKLTVTMGFLGYRKYPPYKRQFEKTLTNPDQLRYVPPGSTGSNLEEFSWFLQVLRALPTLRLTSSGKTADFFVTPWLAQLGKEPLCKASGL